MAVLLFKDPAQNAWSCPVQQSWKENPGESLGQSLVYLPRSFFWFFIDIIGSLRGPQLFSLILKYAKKEDFAKNTLLYDNTSIVLY